MSPFASRDVTGLVVNGRYRLITRIGAGSSGVVYLADDVKLRRRVAVKLLADWAADEPAFVARFRTEMRAAAALRHPHVVVIHDWGIGDDVFVVSEYLENGSLRQLIDRNVRLSPAQALQLGLATARGLAFAHEQGVVHRDLRPSNLLFAADGRLRIADFGLARAAAEAASTEPMGTGGVVARYAAPEQAMGRVAEGKADVYALALILVEAVVGSVPFASDTALATLMARVDAPLRAPAELGVLRDPIERAGTIDTGERIDAAGFVTALMAVAGELGEPDPLPFAGPADAPPPDLTVDDITVVVDPAVMARAREREDQAVGESRGGFVAAGEMDDPEVGSAVPDPLEATVAPVDVAVAAAPSTDVEASEPTPGADDVERRRRNRRRWRLAWVVFALVVVIGGGAVGYLVWQANRTPTHLVPEVAGSSPAVAEARLERLGFEVATRHTRKDGTRAGQILEVDPAPGTRLAEGKTVTLVVSDGQSLVEVPQDLGGSGEAAARTRLEDLGFKVAAPRTRYSEDVAAGDVISLAARTPKELEKGSTVTLVVSKGPKPRVVPDVSGMTPDQASAALERVGLKPAVTRRYDTRVDTGGLIGLDPSPGATVPRGSTVQVVVSKGLLVAVPDLGGVQTVPGAIAKLQAAGLVANNLTGSGKLSGKPTGFDPPAGQLVPKGSPVNIVVQ